MKHIINILGDIVKVSFLAALIGITFFAASSANAQDLYQIEQSFGHDFTVKNLYIGRGWDVRLIQTPKGTPTQVVLTTPYADFFAEDAEPTLLEVKKWSKKDGYYYLKANQWMPHTTIVEIYTSQPIENIELYKGARLTIQHYDFDSIYLDITADTGAVLVIDTLNNRYSTSITVSNATLDLRHFAGRLLNIYAYGESTVKEGEVRSSNQWLTMGEKTTSNITATDSTRHIYVKTKKSHDRERKLHMFNLTLGFDLSMPITWLDNSLHGSPYNTNYGLAIHDRLLSNDMAINRHLTWNFGLDISFNFLQLDNVVKVDGDRLILDPSYGATPPRQELYWCAIGLPVTLKYNFNKRVPYFRNIYATLTPTFNFKPRLFTQTLDENDHWDIDHEKVDILNRFNVRAAIGLDCNIGGLGKIEFFIDLLPTYKSSADAPQTRMFGLSYIF